jgi:OmpA-OmpF porin, OOP family
MVRGGSARGRASVRGRLVGMRRALLTTTVLLLGARASTASAAEPAPAPTASEAAEPTAPPRTRTRLSPREDRPWIERWAPERDTVELGVHTGLLVTSRRIELFEASFDLPDQGYRPFARVAPVVGARASFMALRWGGAELEVAAMPTRTETRDASGGGNALLWTARGAVVGQLPLWSVTPFVLIGGGLIGVSSDRSVVGNDVDAAMYVGGGAKVHVNRFIHVRLDVRDVVTARRGYEAGLSNNAEILLGVGVTLGRRRDEIAVPRRSAPGAAASP